MKISIFSISGIKDLLIRYREIVLYLIVGVITTVINGAVYWICTSLLKMANVPGTIVAWVIAVLFAFFANKIWVFESRSMRLALVLKEMVQFVGCRLGTGVLDVGIMYVSVDRWGWNGLLMKLISDFVVTLVNFVASKFFIFRKDKTSEEPRKMEKGEINVSITEDRGGAVHSFYIFAVLPFFLLASYFVWIIASFSSFIFGDSRLFMYFIPNGSKLILPLFWGGTASSWLRGARFWPLYQQEYNILSFFERFRIPENMAEGLCFINNVIWILFSVAFFLFLYVIVRYSKGKGEDIKWYMWLALPLSLLCLLFQFPFIFYFLEPIYAEKMTVLLLSVFGAAYYAALKINKSWLFCIAAVAACLATYYKESNFIFFMGIACFLFLFGWKMLSRKHFYFLIFLFLNSCLFLILYYYCSYSGAVGSYNTGRYYGIWSNVIRILHQNPLFLLSLLLGCVRLFFVIIKRDRVHLWADSLLFASLAFFLSYFALKLFAEYYFLPANIFFLAVLLYWCMHIKWKYCFGIFPVLFILVLFCFGDIAFKHLKQLHKIQESDRECLQEITELLGKSKKLHFVEIDSPLPSPYFNAWKSACLQEFVWFFCGNWRKDRGGAGTDKNSIVPIRLKDIPKYLFPDEIYIIDRSTALYPELQPLYQNIKDVFSSRGFFLYKSFLSYEFFAKAVPLSYPVNIRLQNDSSVTLLGFAMPEMTGRWINEKEAHIKIPLRTSECDLFFSFEGFPFLYQKFDRNEMDIFINGKKLDTVTFELNKGWRNQLLVPRDLIVNGINDFMFRLKELKSPSDFGMQDMRKLGFYLSSIQLKKLAKAEIVMSQYSDLSGFNEAELSGRWSREKEVHVKFSTGKVARDLICSIEGFPFLHEKFSRNEMSVYLNGKKLEKVVFELGKSWNNQVRFPKELIREGSNDIMFLFKEVRSPSDFGIQDMRKLGFHFKKIRIEEE